MAIRWRLVDPSDGATYSFEINPNEMDAPFGERSISFDGTTAVDGQPIMWEGVQTPAQFSFSGTILTPAQYEAMRHWVYDRRGRLWLYDHYGRRLSVILSSFKPTPLRSLNRYWRHEYTVSGYVTAVTAPTEMLTETL